MRYKLEELLPIVAELSKKFTGFESTSVTYEAAQQLMEAVLYCINEVEAFGGNYSVAHKGMSAREVYERGHSLISEKVKAALKAYNAITINFDSYGNRCLHDTFIKGIHEFFKWYNIDFAPQNTILTLDYPVLKDISGMNGIDAVFEYINCIRLEQKFLSGFSRESVESMLNRYSSIYKEMVENICQIVFMNVSCGVLAELSKSEEESACYDYEKLIKRVDIMGREGLVQWLKNFAAGFVADYYENDGELTAYLELCVRDNAVRIENALKNNRHILF